MKPMAMAALAALALGACTDIGGEPLSPQFNGNVEQTCVVNEALGADMIIGKIEGDGQPGIGQGSYEYTAPAGYQVFAYCVKAGSAQQGDGPEFVEVNPPQATVTISHPSGKNISHYIIYLVRNVEDYRGEWCSPGYWRQPQHAGSWAATGYAPTDLFTTATGGTITRSPQGVRQGAPTSPTLLQVLQNPQWYGGDAFNAVGDLLSDAHPDVDFLGERVADSCPLGRATN